MFSRQFWFSDNGVLVRAIRTAAQTAIAAIGVGTTNLFSADLKNVAALAGSAAILSILMSLDRSTTGNGTVATPTVSAPPTDNGSVTYTPPADYPSGAHGMAGESLR